MYLDQHYEILIDELGGATSQRKISATDIKNLEPFMPNIILQIWDRYGLPSFNYGEYSLINPKEWDGCIDDWIEVSNFRNLRPFFALAKDAFGAIKAYSPSARRFVLINPLTGEMKISSPSKDDERSIEINIGVRLLSIHRDGINIILDDKDEPLFPQALKKLGPLEWDEMYTFEPPRFLGGSGALETIAKVKAQPQYGVLLGLKSLVGGVESIEFKMPPGFDV